MSAVKEWRGITVGVIVNPANNAGSDVARGLVVQLLGDHTQAMLPLGYRSGPHNTQAQATGNGDGTAMADVIVFTRPSANSTAVAMQYVDGLELFDTLADARLAGPATTAVPVAGCFHPNGPAVIS